MEGSGSNEERIFESTPVSIGDDDEGHRASCLSRRKDPQRRTCVAEETTEAARVHAVHEEGTSRYTPHAKPSFSPRDPCRSKRCRGHPFRSSRPRTTYAASNQHIDGSQARVDEVISLSSLCTVVFESTSRPSARLACKATSCFVRVHTDEAANEGPGEFLLSRDGRSSVEPHVTCPCRHEATHGERSRRRKHA